MARIHLHHLPLTSACIQHHILHKSRDRLVLLASNVSTTAIIRALAISQDAWGVRASRNRVVLQRSRKLLCEILGRVGVEFCDPVVGGEFVALIDVSIKAFDSTRNYEILQRV